MTHFPSSLPKPNRLLPTVTVYPRNMSAGKEAYIDCRMIGITPPQW